jgi:hypothetical protein
MAIEQDIRVARGGVGAGVAGAGGGIGGEFADLGIS